MKIHHNVYYFEYGKCRPANQAKLIDLGIKPSWVPTDEILPEREITLLLIEHRIVCVAEKDLELVEKIGEKRGVKIGVKRGVKIGEKRALEKVQIILKEMYKSDEFIWPNNDC